MIWLHTEVQVTAAVSVYSWLDPERMQSNAALARYW